MKVLVRKIHNSGGVEIGAVLTAFVGPATLNNKLHIENSMTHYAFEVLYPGEALSLYREQHSDAPAVVVIKGINNLPYDQIEL